MNCKIFIAVLCLLLLPVASAQLSNAEIDIIIIEDKAVVTKEYRFTQAVDFEELLPEDAVGVEIKADSTRITSDSNPVQIPGSLHVTISYVTKEPIQEDNSMFFIEDNALPFVADSIDLSITLPENVRLTEPLSSPTASIIPKPSTSQTDGQFLIFTWQREDISELPVFISYKRVEEQSTLGFLIILGIIFAVAAVVISFILRDSDKSKKPDFISSHLKEDEIVVLNALKMKEGQTTQATLRVVTGYSKASLSRILKELEERNIVHREQQGNKNIVTLREAQWNKIEQKEAD